MVVIWDWNGTLLNDVQWCIESMNRLLGARGKKLISGVEEYHKMFCFPVKDYYRNVGFDFSDEPFETLAREYISVYHGAGSERLQLYLGADDVLSLINEKREISQVILSASSKENLFQQTGMFDVEKYFDEILGISNIYAKSKVETGLDYMSRRNVQNAMLIGDTVHDFEVARELGADCLLIANGHQSMEKLLSCGVPVLRDIREVLRYV